MSKAGSVVVGMVVVAGIIAPNFVTVISPGEVGVENNKFKGGVQEQVLTEGLNFVHPVSKISKFPISTEVVYMSADEREGSKENESINVSCSDGSLNADVTFNYAFRAADAPDVQRKFRGKDGEDIMNIVLRGQLRGWISEVTKNYSTMEVHLTKKEEINSKLTDHLNKKAKDYGVNFENVTLAETRAKKSVQEAIEARQKVSQELEKQKQELKKVEVEKQKAKLEAEKKAIIAEGERKANEIKAQGLDEKILKEKAIEKWNGQPAPTMQIKK